MKNKKPVIYSEKEKKESIMKRRNQWRKEEMNGRKDEETKNGSSVHTKLEKRKNFIEALKKKTEMKIRVNEELSRELQELGFYFGVCWATVGTRVQHTERPFLFFTLDDESSYNVRISLSTKDDYFKSCPEAEYLPETDELVPTKKDSNSDNN